MDYQALSLSLLITLVGMTIVFAAIVILWIGIVILVRLTQDGFPKRKGIPQNQTPNSNHRMKLAAAAAVAYALAVRDNELESHQQFPLPPTAFVSAWQAVMRANIFGKRGRVR
jgi:Na+-transporting methylmalonyl-CoA/oxaloacetate decarboxylase gamma subunit